MTTREVLHISFKQIYGALLYRWEANPAGDNVDIAYVGLYCLQRVDDNNNDLSIQPSHSAGPADYHGGNSFKVNNIRVALMNDVVFLIRLHVSTFS